MVELVAEPTQIVDIRYWNPGVIVALPLVGAAVLLLFGRRIGRASGVVASTAVGVAFVYGVVVFGQLLSNPEEGRAQTFRLFDWVVAGDFDVGVDLLVDQLSMLMVLVVTGVGALIHIYSIGYMEGDPRYSRYFAYLNLFAASMLLLVLADNLLLLYVGWEAVGLSSYLLIGFWFERDSAANAAKKAFIVNRIGDFAFLVGIFLLASTVGGLAVGQINAEAGAMSAGIATTASLLLFAGATGKSAQIPLYVWLPDAMEGPTPVSALIHAATMVTAGVYVVARFSPVFEASGGSALTVVAWVGAATALWAALMALTEYDIKRVLAYSTISQLGYMFLANGVGAYSIAMFHLTTHAFFKALMFLGAGAVMHALNGNSDMRVMGGLRRHMPVVALTFVAGWLAITGIIPFAGFFSKDAVLAAAWEEGEFGLWTVGTVTALVTGVYMSRLYFRVFEGAERIPEGAHPHDAPATMAAALIPLGVLSVVGGAVNLPGVLTLESFLEPAVGESEVPGGITPWLLAAVALVVAAAGIAAAYALYLGPRARALRDGLYARLSWFVDASRRKFWVDELYGRALVLPGKAASNALSYVFDERFIDGFFNGVATVVAGLAEGTRRVQSGFVRNYALTFLVGVMLLFSVLFLRVVAT